MAQGALASQWLPVPTVADVERIAALGDPVLRNLQITQCYCELSRLFAARTGGEPANWCTFATWASKQAGQTIRKEDLRRAFERVFTRVTRREERRSRRSLPLRI